MAHTMNRLSGQELLLLREAVTRNAPSLAPLVDHIGRRALSPEERRSLQLAVSAELTSSGLGVDSEPNDRGRILDQLIGRLSVM